MADAVRSRLHRRRERRRGGTLELDYAALGEKLSRGGIDIDGDQRQGRRLRGRGAVLGRRHRRHAVRALPRRRRAARHLGEARRLRGDPDAGAGDADGCRCTSPGTWWTTRPPCRRQGDALGLGFDAMNSNTFQDQPGQALSYKFGSLIAHRRRGARAGGRAQPRLHRLRAGARVEGADRLDRRRLELPRAEPLRPGLRALPRQRWREIYAGLPEDWRLFSEHKMHEPAFYSTVVQDWGTNYLIAQALGERAFCLVDLGHHAPNVNIEMIVSRLIQAGKLGGFHFNDSKYGDDDLDAGAIEPYRLFLVFNELVDAEARGVDFAPGAHDRPVAQRHRSDREPDGRAPARSPGLRPGAAGRPRGARRGAGGATTR